MPIATRTNSPRANPPAWLFWGLLTFAVILRLTSLSTWPTPQADEGLWTIGAKNYVLFGDWFLGDQTHFFLSPLFHFLSAGVFGLTDPGIEAARFISASAAVASVGLLYLIVERLSGTWILAMLSAAIFAVSEFSVFHSRLAVVESVQVLLLLGSVFYLIRGTAVSDIFAMLFLALALLAKINSVFFLPVVALVVWFNRTAETTTLYSASRIIWLVLGALLVAGAFYASLYLWRPAEFLTALTYELNGVHFESLSKPVIRLGRFGFDPSRTAESIMRLIRQMPVVLTISALGMLVSWRQPSRPRTVMGVWLLVGTVFYLIQMYQPTRYFFLVFPAVAYFAAFALSELVNTTTQQVQELEAGELSRLSVLIGGVILFELFYIGGGITTNATRGLTEINEHFAQSQASDVVLARPYLCIGISQKCYSSAKHETNYNSLRRAIRHLHVDYVVAGRNQTGWLATLSNSKFMTRSRATELAIIYRVGAPQ